MPGRDPIRTRVVLGVVLVAIAIGLVAIATDRYFLGATLVFLAVWLHEDDAG